MYRCPGWTQRCFGVPVKYMRIKLSALLGFILAIAPLFAQDVPLLAPPGLPVVGTLPATGVVIGSLIQKSGASAGVYSGAAGNTWIGPFGAAGSSIAFPQSVTGCVSGGVVFGSSSTTQINCGALLAANGAMVGGGVGASPAASSQSTVANLGTPLTEIWTMANAGLATTPGGGYQLLNTTASTSGATVQVSPQLLLGSHAWKSSATAADQLDCWQIFDLPATGGSVTTHELSFYSSVNAGASCNGGTYSFAAQITGAGELLLNSIVQATGANFLSVSVEVARPSFSAIYLPGVNGGIEFSTTIGSIAPTGGACWDGTTEFTVATCLDQSSAGMLSINTSNTGNNAAGSLQLTSLTMQTAGVFTYPDGGSVPVGSVLCFKSGGIVGYATNSAGVIGTTCN